MKTYAGDLLVELPGVWENDSSYVYRQTASDAELRFENSPVAIAAVADDLVDPMIARLKQLGPLHKVQRGTVKVGDKEAATLAVSCKRDGDSQATLMQVMVFKAAPERAVTITALAPDTPAGQQALQQAWRTLVASLRVVEIP